MDSDRDMELNDEISALVQVAPSPDFTARVRQQLRGETIDSAPLGRWPWLVVTAAVVAASIVITIGLDRRRAPTLETPSVAVRSEGASGVSTTSLVPSTAGHIIQRRDGSARAQNAAGAITRAHIVRPAVLISPEEAEGVALLVARIEDGRLNDAAFDGTPQPPDSIDIESAALDVLHVEPLAPIPPLEGAIP